MYESIKVKNINKIADAIVLETQFHIDNPLKGLLPQEQVKQRLCARRLAC